LNVNELQYDLEARRIPADAYSLGADRDESYCLLAIADQFCVYYSERGIRNDERYHGIEDDACRDLRDRLLRDRAVMRRVD
jgi:hypothetical protein